MVAWLIATGPNGRWAESILAPESLVAPHHMPAEAANVLRRLVLARDLSSDSAVSAHEDLIRLGVQLAAYPLHAERVWELRGSLTPFDAWYVALAESLNAPLVTLDRRLARARGPTCDFLLPP